MDMASFRIRLLVGSALLLTLAGIAVAQGQTVRADVQSVKDRKPAPDFALDDAAGKSISLTDYHGKVVLLDFWATWCTGCKEEIPWFSQFEKTYGPEGFVVIGVSMDDGGWPVVKPFLADTKVPYRMLLGNDQIAQKYNLKSLPDTFLIDRDGRIAAAYTTGLVDKDNVETNIRTILSKQ